jgi:hypothetical protein
MSKYQAKKVTLNGITFDSKKEANRYRELVLLERAGQIQNLRTQVKFELIPSQRKNGKVVERACHYVADFVYEVPWHKQYENKEGHVVFADGFETVVEDTKGFKTKDYIIKRKLMLWVHDIVIQEV